MKRFIALMLLCVMAPLNAQEGHPLAGTWQGEWGNGQFLTLILTWDGKAISGMANPGPAMTELASGTVVLNSSNWTVTINTDLKDDNGNTLHFSASGKLDNIGSPLRVLNGEWTSGKDKGVLTLSRQGGA